MKQNLFQFLLDRKYNFSFVNLLSLTALTCFAFIFLLNFSFGNNHFLNNLLVDLRGVKSEINSYGIDSKTKLLETYVQESNLVDLTPGDIEVANIKDFVTIFDKIYIAQHEKVYSRSKNDSKDKWRLVFKGSHGEYQWISSMVEMDNKLYIGQVGDVFEFDPQTNQLRKLDDSNGPVDNYETSLTTINHKLYIGQQVGIFEFNPQATANQIRQIVSKEDLFPNGYKLNMTAVGSDLFFSQEKNIYKYDTNLTNAYPVKITNDQFPYNSIESITPDVDKIYVGGEGRVYSYQISNSTWTLIGDQDDLGDRKINGTITKMYLYKGSLYVAQYGRLNVYNTSNGTWSYWDQEELLGSSIYAITEYRENSLLVGQYGIIWQLFPENNNWQVFSKATNIDSRTVFSLMIVDNTLYAGQVSNLWKKDLSKDTSKWIEIENKNQLIPDSAIFSLVSKNNDIYFSMVRALYKYNIPSQNLTKIIHETQLSDWNVKNLQIWNNKLLFNQNKDVYLYDLDTQKLSLIKSSKDFGEEVHSMKLWGNYLFVSQAKSLYRYDLSSLNSEWEQVLDKTKLRDEIISSITASEKHLYLGQNGYIFQYNPQTNKIIALTDLDDFDSRELISQMVIEDNQLFAAQSGQVWNLDLENPKIGWRKILDENQIQNQWISAMIANNNKLYIGQEGKVYQFSLENSNSLPKIFTKLQAPKKRPTGSTIANAMGLTDSDNDNILDLTYGNKVTFQCGNIINPDSGSNYDFYRYRIFRQDKPSQNIMLSQILPSSLVGYGKNCTNTTDTQQRDDCQKVYGKIPGTNTYIYEQWAEFPDWADGFRPHTMMTEAKNLFPISNSSYVVQCVGCNNNSDPSSCMNWNDSLTLEFKVIEKDETNPTPIPSSSSEPTPTPTPNSGLTCKKEGETLPITDTANPPVCCLGLSLIRPKSPSTTEITGICTSKCGNNVCDSQTESNYNCSQDCNSGDQPGSCNCTNTIQTITDDQKCIDADKYNLINSCILDSNNQQGEKLYWQNDRIGGNCIYERYDCPSGPRTGICSGNCNDLVTEIIEADSQSECLGRNSVLENCTKPWKYRADSGKTGVKYRFENGSCYADFYECTQ